MTDVLAAGKLMEAIVESCQYFFVEDEVDFKSDDIDVSFSTAGQLSRLLCGHFTNTSNSSLASGDLDKLHALQFNEIEFFAAEAVRMGQ